MDLNATLITLDGLVEVQRFRPLYFLVVLVAFLLIVFFNASIVVLIAVKKNLHQPMYVFIGALLSNSILLSSNIFPKLLLDVLWERQLIAYPACILQIFFFYSLSFSEFLLLAAMAVDRYASICRPLQYHSIMTRNSVSVLLALAWLLPACHVAAPLLLNMDSKLCRLTLSGIFCNNAVMGLYCYTPPFLTFYGLLVLFNVGLLPVLFIAFTYTKILVVALRSCGELRRKAAQTCLPHLLVLVNYVVLMTYDVVVTKLDSGLPKVARVVVSLQIIVYNPLCNPLIYGLKMKEISVHLKKLFCQTKTK